MWLDTGETVLDLDPPTDHPFVDQLREAISEQNHIGWDHVLRGQLSKSWGLSYVSWRAHVGTSTNTAPPITAIQWATKIASWGFSHFLQLWKHRNDKAHEKTTTTHTSLHHVRLQAKVRDYYSRSGDLPRSDQHAYFHDPIEVFQLQPPHILEVWIAQIDRIFIKHRKEICQRFHSHLITNFFVPIPRHQPVTQPSAAP
jgi:hypothetical protein